MFRTALRRWCLSSPTKHYQIRKHRSTTDFTTRTMSETTGGRSDNSMANRTGGRSRGYIGRGEGAQSGRGRGRNYGRSAGRGRGRGEGSIRYTPPHRRHGPANEAANDPKETRGEAPSYSTPQKKNRSQQNRQRRGPRGGSKNHFEGRRGGENRGGQRLKVYHTADNNDDGDPTDLHKSFREMRNDCKALRYKVHKPRCDCPKLLRMIEKHDFSHELTGGSVEDGKIDALVVVPDTKQQYIYVCRDTPLSVFEEDPRKAEWKLRRELFPETTTTDDATEEELGAPPTTGTDESKFKLSCASCLLKGHEPNGFCVISSSSPDIVDMVRDTSRSKRREKEETGRPLHPDHAHFVARLSRNSLWKLYRSKTRSQTSQAVEEIFGYLSEQDIDAVSNVERFTDGIELGHHLVSLLALTDKSDDFWFVIGYDDHKSLQLDLPGGKRHLGETSLEGAIRETEEESSLVWEPSWVLGALEGKKASEGGNRYFLLHPPQSFLDTMANDG
mmetsp:Transcript_33579/g.79183  ORF Transcript_33579/g.79183 Transcript_33579/m.79183 type:complete len:501 (-) Transcript_33579:327-1829(-)